MGMGGKAALLVGAAVMANAAAAQPAGQKVTGPVAVYWMSATTQSGFGMPGMGGPGGGGRPSAADMMRMMQGGGAAQHSLVLQLGSSEAPKGAPHAEHLPPSGLGAGPSLPLITPQAQVTPVRDEEPQVPREYQKPKGRMLIFWGCGEHARPGQPVVIDFAQLTPEKVAAGPPPALAQMMRGLDMQRMRPPSAGRNATYGEWPNAQGRKAIPSEGSLVGQHVVTGDYSPEIHFTLSPAQDFLGPLNLTGNERMRSGAVQLGWNGVPGAEGYIASMIGGGQNDTVVLWTSSEAQTSAFALPDFIPPGDIARLVAAKALMDPQTTACIVPQEAASAARGGLVQLVAYGREANFSYPPRPSDPKVAWNRQWEVKVRYRSATGGLLGESMPQMDGGGGFPRRGPPRAEGGQPDPSPADAAAARRRGILGGLGGLIPHSPGGLAHPGTARRFRRPGRLALCHVRD
ncbi:MAG: hypothetical protein ACJ798_02415 [Phenylobacterium sp.]